VAFQPWRAAWQEALYGPGGFYRQPEGPAGHFRTASHAAGEDLAACLARLAAQHGCTAIVDVGAGRGELLSALAGLDCGPDAGTGAGLRLHGVDVVPRPAGLPGGIAWSAGLSALPAPALSGALVVAWELLDVVPCTVLEVDDDGRLREVLIEAATGRERLGGPATGPDLDWCNAWWPQDCAEEGDRVEVGSTRDALWSSLLATAFDAGARAALAVDYGHRRAGRPPLGSLTGFQRGRAVPPRPDGSMDVTAHVSIDSAAACGQAALGPGGTTPHLTTQAEALRELGSRAPELLDPGSLGGFDWLLQLVP
jgi:SAM-dependent MidA family methyltransferase